MTLKEFAYLLDGREYRCEITPSEEALAKELGFVVVFGYSDDNAELRGAIDDEISCYDGGVLEHKDLPSTIYADWCPKDLDCAWAYSTSIPHEKFEIYDHGELYCVGIVCDINKPKPTNADRIRSMTDEELAKWMSGGATMSDGSCYYCKNNKLPYCDGTDCIDKSDADIILEWLQQPAEGDA